MKNPLIGRTGVAAIVCIAILTACGSGSTKADAAAPPKPSGGTKTDIGNLPTSRQKVSFETKYTKAIPIAEKQAAYEIVDQWIFRPDDEKDGTLICVDDDQHCIPLLKLKEQLGRPANDPLGIR